MPDNNMMQTIGMASNPNFDPAEYARQQQALAMGQALLQGSMQSPEGQMVSGHYVAPSWTQQIARVLSGYAGNKAATDANAYMLKTNIGNTQAMLNSLPGSNQGAMPAAGAPPGGAAQASPFSQVGYPQAQASSQGAASSGAGYSPTGAVGNNPFTRENVIQGLILNGFSPEAAKAFWARTAPAPTQDQLNSRDPLIGGSVQNNLATQNMTPEQKLLKAWQEAPEGSPQKQVLAGLIQKAQTQVVSGGQSLYGFGGNGPALAAVAPTDKAQYTVGGDGSVLASGIPGAPEIAKTMANAEEAGKGNVEMVQVFNDKTQQMELVPKTIAATAAGGGAPGGSYGTPSNILDGLMRTESSGNPYAINPSSKAMGPYQFTPDTVAMLHKQGIKFDPFDPVQSRQAADYYMSQLIKQNGGDVNKALAQYGGFKTQNPAPYIAKVTGGPMAAGPRIGDTAGAATQATDSQAAWSKLQEATRQAQTTTSYLQNINDLAQKAIVGPASSKLNFANGLLSLLPWAERANNAQTATDLLNKYSSQITARLGAGGMGTDAARTILQAAYPGAHMTADAIHEAVGNLVGANEMVKAKATLLAPYGNNRDYVGYQKKEMAFDKAADPRIWQYKALRETNPQAAQMFLKNTLKQDPHFIDKADVLSEMGAL